MAASSNLFRQTRDLADNWSIDVAAELDAYLNQLESITKKSGDDEESNNGHAELNFVEAALM